MMRLAENASSANGRGHCRPKLKCFNFLPSSATEFQPDVILILKCLMQGENMSDLDHEKLQSRQGSNFIATLLILIDAYFINSI